MANAIRPTGLSPVKTALGAQWTAKTNIYYIPSTDGSAYGIGDLVKSAAGSDVNGYPAVQKCTSGDTSPARGVIVGIFPVQPGGPQSLVGTSLSLEIISVPATKTRGYYVAVDDDPMTIFEVMDDGLATLTATAANKNINLTVANPTAPTQVSASVLNTASVATTSTLQLKLMGIKPSVDNQFPGPYTRWLCKINTHELSGGPGTAGV